MGNTNEKTENVSLMSGQGIRRKEFTRFQTDREAVDWMG